MFRIRPLPLLGLLTALVLFFAGCGDEPPTSTPDSGEGDTGRDVPLDLYEPDAIGQPHLVVLTEMEPTVSYRDSVLVRVQFLSGTDQPISGQYLTFTPLQDTADTTVTPRNVQTDTSGVGQTSINAGYMAVDFNLQVSVQGDDSVAPVTILVHVMAKDDADYIVHVDYAGPVTLKEVHVQLFDSPRACNALVESWNPSVEPSDDQAWTSLVLLPEATGAIPERAVNVPPGTEFKYAVARGEPVDEHGEGRGYYVTFGCADSIPAPNPTSATRIEITMHNLWPSMEGTYEISSELNLINLIPDQYEQFISVIGEILRNPGQGLVTLIAITACAIAGETECPNSEYWNYSYFEWIFEYNSTTEEASLNQYGVVVATILEALILTGINAINPSAGDTIEEILGRGADVFDNAENFRLGGHLYIQQEPDSTGLLGNANYVRYNLVTWIWDEQERDIQLRNQSVISGNSIEAAVLFHPTMTETYSIAVTPFALQLNYGELMIWVLESVIFPEFIDPSIDSFEDFFNWIIDCEALADDLEERGGTYELLAPLAETACEQLSTAAITFLREWLGNLTADLGSYYHMGTPSAKPCPIYFAPTSQRFIGHHLGESAAANRCMWEGRVRFGEDYESEVVDGNWWAESLRTDF